MIQRGALVIVAAGLLLASLASARAAPPQVVVSLKPLHSLVAGVMAGVAEPHLLLRSGGSPHDAGLRPSDVRALAQADLVIWVGEALETFLSKAIAARVQDDRMMRLDSLDGITLLAARDGGLWQQEEEHEDDHGDHDLHLWLDPANAQAVVRASQAALSALDPANGERYQANSAKLLDRLAALDRDIAAQLAPVRDQPYVVFHDAYQYFERRYGLRTLGAITVSPDRPPGARRLAEIHDQIRERGAICLFSEPQFPPALVETLVRGTAAKTATLDPLGAELATGPEAYFNLMGGMADALSECLQPES